MTELREDDYTKEEICDFLINSTSMQNFGEKLGYSRMPRETFNRILRKFSLQDDLLGKKLNLIKSYSGKLIQDLSNQNFKDWKVISYDYEQSKEHKRSYWVCQCICGTIKSVEMSGLKNPKDCFSCGCKRKNRLIGQRFDKLVVLEATEQRNFKNEIFWKCQCDCGNIVIKSTRQLRETIGACEKCQEKSKGEFIISNYLEQFQYNYKSQYSFPDLKGIDNSKLLRFDFAILDNSNNVILLIEFQGSQHYMPVENWGGEKRFQIQQENDQKKEEYCDKHGIPLLIFTYKEINKMTNDYIGGKINGILRQ